MSNHLFKSITLHVGLPKTGTTSIQNYCHKYASHLASFNIHYPQSWPRNHTAPLAHIAQSVPHINRISAKGITKQDTNPVDYWLQLFNEELRSCSADNLLLSSELIPNFDISSLYNLKNFLLRYTNMIKIIMYVRHPVNLAESLVPTLLWYGGFPRVEIDQILLLKFQNYFKSRIQKIENVFGNDNLIITSYEAAQNHPNRIVGHFLDQINVAYQPFDAASFAFNSRPSQISCEIINRYNLNLAQSTNLDTADNIHKLYQLEGDVFKLPDAQRKNIYEINKSDSHWLYEYTQIDYRDFPTQTSQMQSAHDSQNKMSLFSLFNVLTPTLQRATIDYLNEHQHDLFDDDQITFLTQSHTAKRRFINNPKINPRISIESMYISCAAVLAAHNDFDMALRVLNYAQIYNQESDHIKQKIEEYTLYVSKPD